MNWLLANSIAALGLSLLVLLIARIWKPAPSVMHGLWLVVVFKLVTPPLFEVPIDFSWLAPVNTATAEPQPPAPEPTATPILVETAAPRGSEPDGLGPVAATGNATAGSVAAGSVAAGSVDTTAATPAATRPSPSRGPLATTSAANPAPQPLAIPWGLLWLGTSSLLLLATAWSTFRVHRRKKAFGPVPIDLRLEVRELAERIGVDVPEMCDDPNSAAPYVWTVGKTRLVLPVAILRACSRKGRAAVLAHELAHLHRKDHWIARCELLLLTVLWWHPLFWFARSRMRLWAELACDQIAVTTVPDASLDYATLLVDAAARPLNPPPGVAVLASRPAARAAFERRLKMILSETPRRASRAWCVPFAGLALGLFAVPVAAQHQDPDPVRIEIRVNGKAVKNLSNAQRQALLEVLLDEKSAPRGKKQRGDRRIVVRSPKDDDRDTTRRRRKNTKKIEGLPDGAEIKKMLDAGLAEARAEIKSDPDLKELGITDEVLGLIDDIQDGKGIEGSLDGVIKAAMKGAGDMVLKELNEDEDLRRLGLNKGIAKLVTGFLENDGNQKLIGDLARTAIHSAIGEAKAEIRADKDLRKLGLTGDVERLIDSVISGQGNFEKDLEGIIEKAMKAAMAEAEGEIEKAKPKKRRATVRRRTPETIR